METDIFKALLPDPTISGLHCTVCKLRKDGEKLSPGGLCASCVATIGLRAEKTKLAQETGRFVKMLRAPRIDAPHISQVCEQMARRFHGVENFTVFWKNQIDVAAMDHPGGKLVLDSCYAFVKLVSLSTEHRQTAPDVCDMSDEDLEREFQERVTKLKIAPPPQLEDQRERTAS